MTPDNAKLLENISSSWVLSTVYLDQLEQYKVMVYFIAKTEEFL